MFEVDLSEVTDGIVPPGADYGLRVKRVQGHTYMTGTPGILVWFDVEEAPAVPDAVGREVFASFPLAGPGTAFAIPFLKACGVPVGAAGKVHFHEQDLEGRRIYADICHRAFNGETRVQLKRLRSRGT